MANDTTAPPVSVGDAGPAQVLADISGMLGEMLEEYGLEDLEITMDTSFHDDLELESIDLVTLAGRLQQRYGEPVNLAEFLADKDLDEVIGLRIGALVDYVVNCLHQAENREH